MMPQSVLETSTAGDRPTTISYPAALLNELRARAFDGMNRLRNGGVEIGGILLGVREEGVIRILDHRSLPCEHAYGPGFLLSPRDVSNLRLLLTQPVAGGLTPVGWYHSHTRSDLALSDRDVEIHQGFFADPLCAALVLRPAANGSAEAYFHLQNAEGGFDPVASERVVTVLPPERPAVERSVRTEPRASRPEAAPVRWEASRENPPALAVKPWMVAALCVGWFTAGLFLAGIQPVIPTAAPKPLALTVVDRDGQMQIAWERGAPSVRTATHAFLAVSEGPNVRRIELTPDLLQEGTLAYQRRSGQVDFELTVYGNAQAPDRAVARFVGAPVLQTADARAAKPPANASRTSRPRPAIRQAPPAAATVQTAAVARQSDSPPPAPETAVVEMTPTPPSPALIEPAPALVAAKQAHSSGRVIWTGYLPKNRLLLIEGGKPSTGVLSAPLPASPIQVEALPAALSGGGMTVYSREREGVERAGIDNGWNETIYKRDPRRARDLVLAEPPAAPTHWNKLALRGGRDLSAIVIHWRRIEP